MDKLAAPPSSLVACFHQFYRELIRAKRRARGWREATPAEAGAEAAPSAIWQDLLTALERQDLAFRGSEGSLAGELFREAQYVMAALADEVFLHLDWPGREAWKGHLLEARLFGTHRAGDAFFARLEQILARFDPAFADLARVYLLALALGFEGKYRGRPDAASQLAAYRRRLYQSAYHREPDFESGRDRLLPQAYVATLEEGRGARLPYLDRWGLAMALVIALWIVLSIPLWRRLTADLEPILERILA